MILYHYTSILHLPHILAHGFLRPTESNVGITTSHEGPDVVWLTTDEDVGVTMEDNHGLGIAKTRIRFAVELPDQLAIKWSDWEWYHRMDPEWRDTLIQAGGGQESADTWYVVPGPIRRDRWVGVIDRFTETVLEMK